MAAQPGVKLLYQQEIEPEVNLGQGLRMSKKPVKEKRTSEPRPRASSSRRRDSRSAEQVVDRRRTKSTSGPSTCTNDYYRSRSCARSRGHSERSPSHHLSMSSGPSSRKHSREKSLSSSSPVHPKRRKQLIEDETPKWAKNLGDCLGLSETEVRRASKSSTARPMEKAYRFEQRRYAEQYEFNTGVYELLQEAAQDSSDEGRQQALGEGLKLIKERNKLLTLADKYGWGTAAAYMADPIASDSEDEKEFIRPKRRHNQQGRKKPN